MANDISGINSSKPQQANSQNEQASNDVQATHQRKDTAETLNALEKQLSQEPLVNEQKIARVRAALENGNYQVDSEKIAQKMLDFESHLDN